MHGIIKKKFIKYIDTCAMNVMNISFQKIPFMDVSDNDVYQNKYILYIHMYQYSFQKHISLKCLCATSEYYCIHKYLILCIIYLKSEIQIDPRKRRFIAQRTTCKSDFLYFFKLVDMGIFIFKRI